MMCKDEIIRHLFKKKSLVVKSSLSITCEEGRAGVRVYGGRRAQGFTLREVKPKHSFNDHPRFAHSGPLNTASALSSGLKICGKIYGWAMMDSSDRNHFIRSCYGSLSVTLPRYTGAKE